MRIARDVTGYTLARSVALCLLLSTGAAAQSKPGASFDQTITRVVSARGRTDSSTNLLHLTAAQSNMRIEMSSNRLFSQMGAFNPGPHTILLIHDGGKEMVFVNPDSREYLALKPMEMIEAAAKMLQSMGGSMTFDTAASIIHLDSLGTGPVIDGHPTIHYRLTTQMKMSMSMMGQVNGFEEKSTQDIYNATDLQNFDDVSAALAGFAAISQTMGFGKQFLEQVAEVKRKAHGVALRSVKTSTATQMGSTRFTSETTDIRNIKRVEVPDSVFVIPAGYKAIGMPMPATGP